MGGTLDQFAEGIRIETTLACTGKIRGALSIWAQKLLGKHGSLLETFLDQAPL